MDGDAALTSFMARLRALRALAVETAKDAAPLIERAVRATATAGIDPEGRPWVPKEKTGRALEHAASAVVAVAKGAAIDVVLRGYHVFHHRGTKRLPQRRILPDGGAGMPQRIAEALRTAATSVFRSTMGGSR